MDNLEERGEADRSRINFSQDHEITYWTAKFKVSVQQLYSAAREAGSSVTRIEEALLRMGCLTKIEAAS
jgi:hypothetical protein